ncbi:MAG: hypothetical protein HGA76_01580 [Candidatus Firestonebacteria bacterium]|nr:hypothetical protein [Candidatus Firestonebacteria bacterium]
MPSRTWMPVLILGCALGLGCISTSEAAMSGVLLGTIADASHNTPCAGVFVVAFPNSYLPYAAYTDAQGAYVLTLPVVDANAAHYVVLTKTGYATVMELNPPEIAAGQTNTKNASIYVGSLISGHVRTAVGGLPLAGIGLTASGNDPANVFPAVTSTAADGYYELRQPPGTSRLTLTTPQYAPLPTRALVLTDKTDMPGVDFALAVGGSISGRVTYAGTTLPAANIGLLSVYANAADYMPQSVTYTAADGQYLLPHVLPGLNHLIALGPPGYSNAVRYNLAVLDNQNTGAINFLLWAGGSLNGFIRDYLDRPVNAAVVTVFPATGNSNNQQQSTTGPSGTYNFNGLTQGLYSIRVAPPQGLNLQSAEFSGISLQGSVTVTTRNFILQPGGWLEGTVYDAQQQPLSGALVQAYVDMKFPFEKWVQTRTDAAGKYSVDGLSPFQNYTLAITPKASLTALNAAAVVKGLTVTENAGRQQNFFLHPAGGRQGLVTTAAGNSLSAGSVILLNSDIAISADLAADGNFILSYAPEGDYLAVVENVAGHTQTLTDYLHVTAGAVDRYNRQLSAGATIDGYVYDATGNSLAGVKVVAKNKFDVLASLSFFDQISFTDDTGYYRLQGVAPGNYTLQAIPPAVDYGMACRQSGNMTVVEQGNYRYNFSLLPGAKVYGAMHDTSGNRTFTGIIKFWSEADSAVTGEALADQWGNYALMLSPGTYHAQAYFTSILGVNLAMEPLPAVSVPAAPQTLQQEFIMQTGGSFSGRVTDPLGRPLGLCMIQAFQADNPLPARVALTHPDGFYALPGLHSGTFTVSAQTPGYTTGGTTASARIGNTTDNVNLVLVPQTSIAGVVKSADHQPLSQAVIQAWNASGNLQMQVSTDSQGAYVLSPLTPGLYEIKASATGMKSGIQSGHYPGERADFVLESLIGHDEAVSYPNPCRGRTITFLAWLDQDATVRIRVYNQAGELVWDQQREGRGGAYHKQTWNVDGVAPGVYLHRITVRSQDGGMHGFPVGKLTVIK